MVYPVGILAALLVGVGYVLQQRVASTAPLADILRWRLLLDLISQKMWWAGIGCMVLGQVLSGLALQLAGVALVEPLLSTSLLFALAIAALFARRRPALTEIGGAVLLSAALGVFIAVGNPKSSDHADGHPAIITMALIWVMVAVALCVIIGRRSGLVRESVWLATGAGLMYGLQDAATRAALVNIDDHGISALFVNLWIYVVIAAAVFGILLSQSAFKAARLDLSLPPIAAAEPVAGIALGIGLLGDTVSVTIGGLAVESACLLAMVVGVALIGRSPNLAAACAEPRAPAPAKTVDRAA